MVVVVSQGEDTNVKKTFRHRKGEEGMSRWTPTKKASTAQEMRAAERARALTNCQKGEHTMIDLLSVGVRICQWCNLTLYCPICNPAYRSQHPNLQRAYEMKCQQHRAEVQL